MPGGFRRRRARNDERVRVDGNGLRRALAGEAGLADDELTRRLTRLDEERAILERQRRPGFVALPGARAELRRALELADAIRASSTDVVVLGSGDLARGIRGIAASLAPRPRDPAAAPPGTPRLHVFDRVEPARFAAVLGELDLATTVFDVIDVAGESPAVMGSFLIVRERLLRELGAVAYQSHVVVTTGAGDGALRQIVHDEGFRSLALPEEVDGNGATLSPAALVPLASIGIDAPELRAGGTTMLERCRGAAEGASPVQLVAMAVALAAPSGLRVVADAPELEALSRWIARRTATAAIGDDPPASRRDVALVIACAPGADDVAIPKSFADLESVGYLGGQTLAALAAHERTAEEMARSAAGTLTIELTLPALTPHAVGQLVALIDAAVMLARGAANAPVDVATARIVAGLAGRPGHEADRGAAQHLVARREDRYVA